MQRDSFLRVHLPGILLLVALAVSLLLYYLVPTHHVARTLFFPGTTDLSLSGERRLVPRTSDEERSIELVVEELLLGPSLISNGRLFPRESSANALVIRDRIVYVDLNQRAMLESPGVRISFADAIGALRETVLHNFRHLDDVVVTVEGSLPYTPSYR